MSAKLCHLPLLLLAASILAPAPSDAHTMTIFNCTSAERTFIYYGDTDDHRYRSISGGSSDSIHCTGTPCHVCDRDTKNCTKSGQSALTWRTREDGGKADWAHGAPAGGVCG